MATIRDVAREANVSVATVSRVLNGNYPVSEEKKTAVQQAVKKLHFTPNVIGQNLGRAENRTILVVTAAMTNELEDSPLLNRTLMGIHEVAEQEGYDVLISYLHASSPNAPTSPSMERCLAQLRGGLAGGCIVLGPILKNQPAFFQLENCPTVRCGEGIFKLGGNCVTYDNEFAGYDLCRFLVQKGCRRFSFVLNQKVDETEPSDYSVERMHGALRALAEAGIPYDDSLTLVCRNSDAFSKIPYDSAAEQMQFFARLPREQLPDAILCTYDVLSLACIHTLQSHGIRVPEDVAIAGFDDSAAATFSIPALTTVRQPNLEMGREATKLLIELMQGKRQSGVRTLLPHTIIARGSTDRILSAAP